LCWPSRPGLVHGYISKSPFLVSFNSYYFHTVTDQLLPLKLHRTSQHQPLANRPPCAQRSTSPTIPSYPSNPNTTHAIMPSKIQLDENLWFLYICLQKSDLKTARLPLPHFLPAFPQSHHKLIPIPSDRFLCRRRRNPPQAPGSPNAIHAASQTDRIRDADWDAWDAIFVYVPVSLFHLPKLANRKTETIGWRKWEGEGEGRRG
jgi:hypothetical protein